MCYLHRYIIFLSLLKYSRGINFTDIQDEMNSDLQELAQDVSNDWKRGINGVITYLLQEVLVL